MEKEKKKKKKRFDIERRSMSLGMISQTLYCYEGWSVGGCVRGWVGGDDGWLVLVFSCRLVSRFFFLQCFPPLI